MNNNKNSDEEIPKISVGFPLYNGEEFLRTRLDSILSQTFSDFELIISDNGSTDSSVDICNEYEKKDKRIRFCRNDKNFGPVWSFQNVLYKARAKYFIWVAADDKFSNDFLEKNFNILEANENIVASTSKVEWYGPTSDIRKRYRIQSTDSIIKKIYKKIRLNFQRFGTETITGTPDQRSVKFMRNMKTQSHWSLCRRKEVIQSWESQGPSWDLSVMMNLLQYGDFHVIDEVLMYIHTMGGQSVTSFQGYREEAGAKLIFVFFPHGPLTLWFLKRYGTKLFLKNLDYFIWVNLRGFTTIFVSIGVEIKNRFVRKQN